MLSIESIAKEKMWMHLAVPFNGIANIIRNVFLHKMVWNDGGESIKF